MINAMLHLDENVTFSSFYLLEDQLYYNYIDVTDLFTHKVMFVDHIFVVLDPFRRCLRVFHLEFDRKPFLMDAGVKIAGIGGADLNFK